METDGDSPETSSDTSSDTPTPTAAPSLAQRMAALNPPEAYAVATRILSIAAGELADGWDGNARKGLARVDALKLAELRGLVAEQRKAAVRALGER